MRSFQPFAMRFVVTAQVNPSALTCSRMLSGPNRSPRRATCDDTEGEAAQANCSVIRVHALPGPRPTAGRYPGGRPDHGPTPRFLQDVPCTLSVIGHTNTSIKRGTDMAENSHDNG